LLTSFGTFWAVEGLGLDWPGSDLAIVGLLVLYGVLAAAYIFMRRSFRTSGAVRTAVS
jgi:uncharacterized membrane protein